MRVYITISKNSAGKPYKQGVSGAIFVTGQRAFGGRPVHHQRQRWGLYPSGIGGCSIEDAKNPRHVDTQHPIGPRAAEGER